jgi:hypothetical protein
VWSTGGSQLPRFPVWGTLQELNRVGLKFPVLQDPAAAVGLLVGRNADLFTFDMPDFRAGLSRDRAQKVQTYTTPYGPVSVVLYAQAEFSADAQFGCDLAGLSTGRLLDGFYARNVTGSVSLTLGIEGGYGRPGYLFVGVGGSATGTVRFTLDDPNRDGKIRVAELTATPSVSTTGDLGLRLYAFKEEYDAVPSWLDGDGVGLERQERTIYTTSYQIW